jgi:hypothetical protein
MFMIKFKNYSNFSMVVLVDPARIPIKLYHLAVVMLAC